MAYEVNSDIWNQIGNPMYQDALGYLNENDKGKGGWKQLIDSIRYGVDKKGHQNPAIGLALAQNANTRDVAEYATHNPDQPQEVTNAQVRGDTLSGQQNNASTAIQASTQMMMHAKDALQQLKENRLNRGLALRQTGMQLAVGSSQLLKKKSFWDYLQEGVGMASNIAGMFVPGAGIAGAASGAAGGAAGAAGGASSALW